MADAPLHRIVVHAPAAERAALTASVADAGWDVASLEVLTSDSLGSLLAARVLITAGVAESAAISVEAILREHPSLACIHIGSAPVAGARAWLRERPSAEVLKALVRENLPVSAPSTSTDGAPRWRRKGDMIIGRSRQTEELLKTLDRLAPSPAPVLVTGESGTGKELVARALHYCGPRCAERFIALNCAAIPESLFEAELFGHERGAFTGAVTQRPGAFEAAHNGTLFLDEIGELPLAQQAKLLRVLETGEVTRVGSTTPKKVNVRLVAATNRDLMSEQNAGQFRLDLFYRLSVYPVQLTPLRERAEDILPVAHHHLALIASRDKRQLPRLTAPAAERLLRHSWPGNVRELINVLERACLTAPDSVVEPDHLALAAPAGHKEDAPAELLPYRDAKARFEADYFRQLMRVAGGNVSKAAKLAGKTRKEVYDALRRLELDPGAYRQIG